MKEIINFIVENRFSLLIPIIFATILLMLDTYANANKISWVGLILIFIMIGGFVLITLKDIIILKIDLTVFVFSFCIFTFFYNSVIYAKASKKHNKLANLFVTIPSNIESQIYLYLDEKSRPALFTEHFYRLFKHLNISHQNFKRQLSQIIIENKTLSYKEFIKLLPTTEERSYKTQFLFLGNYIVPVEFMKKKVVDHGKLIGFVFINQTLTMPAVQMENLGASFRKKQNVFFELLGKPVAYSDHNSKQITLNSLMAKTLKIEGLEIPYSEFEKYIVEEDRAVFASRKVAQARVLKNYYRMKTVNGVEWFEESSLEYKGEELVVFQRDSSMMKIELHNYANLIEDLKNLGTKDYLVIFIAITNTATVTEKIGKDGFQIVISQYLQKLKEFSDETNKIYKIGEIEYAFIIESVDKFDVIVRDLENEVSNYLGADLYLNELKVTLANAVGIVNTKMVEEIKPESILKAGLDALTLARDINYKKRYSINRYKNLADPSSFNIDLSDDYLDKLLEI